MGLHHVRRGSGPPLVLIPGTSSDHRVWDSVVPALTREREVIAIDVPGFGASAPLPAGEPRDPVALAHAVAGLLDELGLERPHVAGHSLGGAMALELGRMGRARTVCAIAPIGFWTPREAAWCATLLLSVIDLPAVPEAIVRNRVSRTALFATAIGRPWRLSGDEAWTLWTMPKSDLPGIVDAYRAYVVRDGPAIEAACDRVTVAWGTRDRLLLPREGRRVPRVLPGAGLVWLGGLGHTLMWDDPPAAADLLLRASSA